MKMRKVKKSAVPIKFDLSLIPEEYGINISNKFDALLGLAEERTSDRLASETQTITLETAKNHISKRKKKKQQYISEDTLKLIDERRNMKVEGSHKKQLFTKQNQEKLKEA